MYVFTHAAGGQTALVQRCTPHLPISGTGSTQARHQLCHQVAVDDMQKVRYDKIQHVRSAADKALRSLQTLAACSHRSDIAAMPTPERPLTASER